MTLTMSKFNLPTEFKPDTQFGLYCIPLLGDIIRITTVTDTFKILNLTETVLSQADKRSTQIDFAKWVIGMIPAAMIGALSPITGVFSFILRIIALFASIAEQGTIINYKSHVPLAHEVTHL